MSQRYGKPPEGSDPAEAIKSAVNLLSVVFAQIYFPTNSNSLKDIASWLGFTWSDSILSGSNSIVCRSGWESSSDSSLKQKLVTYNAEDCEALELVERVIHHLCLARKQPESGKEVNPRVVYTDALKRDPPYRLGNKTFSMPELDAINKAAYWNYQRERVFVRSSRRLKRVARQKRTNHVSMCNRINKVVVYPAPTKCPHRRLTWRKSVHPKKANRLRLPSLQVAYHRCNYHKGDEREPSFQQHPILLYTATQFKGHPKVIIWLKYLSVMHYDVHKIMRGHIEDTV